MLNLVVNILYGFIGQSLYTGYVYNKIKGKNYKLTWLIFMISTILGFIAPKFTYNYMYVTYIVVAVIFYVLFALIYKQWHQITNFFLILNIMLITSILTALPIIFIGYNKYYIIANVLVLLVMTIIIHFIPFNKIYKGILKNWNRTNNNKIKSVTIRNMILVVGCIFITIINILLNNYILDSYQKLL